MENETPMSDGDETPLSDRDESPSPGTLDAVLHDVIALVRAQKDVLLTSGELAAAEASQAARSGLVLLVLAVLLVLFLPAVWVLLLALIASLLTTMGWSSPATFALLFIVHLLAVAGIGMVMVVMFRRMQFRHTRRQLARFLSRNEESDDAADR